MMTRLWHALLWLIWLVLVGAELTLQTSPLDSFFHKLASGMGAGAWIGSHLLLGVVALWALLSILVAKGAVASLTVLFVYFLLFSLTVTDPASISHESTQQIACALEKLSEPDLGYSSWCFLGYPTRQYYIPALPSLLFGKGQLQLNSGYLYYLLTGIILFAAGIFATFRSRRTGDLAAALCLTLIMHIGWFKYLLLHWEQSIFPFAYTLIITGLYLLSIVRPSGGFMLLAGQASYFAVFGYTPSLATVVLFASFSIGGAFFSQRLSQKLSSFFQFLACSFALLCSFGMRDDLRLTSGRTGQEIASRLTILAQLLVGPVEGFPLMSTTLAAILITVPAIIAVMAFRARLLKVGNSLPRHTGLALFVIVAWGTGVVVYSVLSKGYADPPASFAFHRAIIVFPPLFAVLTVAIARFDVSKWVMAILVFPLLCLSLQQGLWGTLLYQSGREADPKLGLLQVLEAQNLTQGGPIHLLVQKELEGPLGNLGDYAQYFADAPVSYEWVESCTDTDLKNIAQPVVLFVAMQKMDCSSGKFAGQPIGFVTWGSTTLSVLQGRNAG